MVCFDRVFRQTYYCVKCLSKERDLFFFTETESEEKIDANIAPGSIHSLQRESPLLSAIHVIDFTQIYTQPCF